MTPVISAPLAGIPPTALISGGSPVTWASALTSSVGTFAAGCVIFWGVQRVFKAVEDVLTNDAKMRITLWLLDAPSIGTKQVANWPQTFTLVLDRAFGRTLNLRQRLFRSFVIAAGTTAMTFSLWAIAHFGQFRNYINATPYPFLEFAVPLVVVGFPMTYLSLVRSHWLIRRLGRRAYGKAAILIVIADVLVTVVTGSAAYRLYATGAYEMRSALRTQGYGWVIDNVVGNRPGTTLRDDVRPTAILSWDLNAKSGYAPLSAILYASYFSSAWALLYLLAGVILRVAKRAMPGLRVILSWLDIEQKPLQAIGLVTAGIMTVSFWTAEIGREWF